MSNKSNRPIQIGDVCFCRGGWRRCTGTNPLKWSEETISLPKPEEFI